MKIEIEIKDSDTAERVGCVASAVYDVLHAIQDARAALEEAKAETGNISRAALKARKQGIKVS